MGYEYGDAQNSAVRVFLNQFSKRFDTYFDTKWRRKTKEYFDNLCPYTGEQLDDEHLDHIIPFNKEHCGLHIYGNLLVVSSKANKLKHNRLIEEFLKSEPERLIKIQKFMQESGFNEIYNQYNDELKLVSKNLYEQIRRVIEDKVNVLPSQNSFATQNIDKNTTFNAINNLKKPVLTVKSDVSEIKIGELVRQSFIKLSNDNILPDLMIKQLQNADYCKSTFNINYPVLKLIDFSSNISEQRKINGRDRYWANPYYDNKYFICNDWYDKNRYFFDKWLMTINIDKGS